MKKISIVTSVDGNTHLEEKTNNESSEESKYELIEILGVNLALKIPLTTHHFIDEFNRALE